MSVSAILCLPLAYLLGSIPVGFLVARIFYHTDIRQTGSGNIGATNALRQFGTKVGVSVLLLDMLKGILAVVIARNVFGYAHPLVSLCGLLAILGHIFSIWLKFRGGKGVATAAGVFVALAPLAVVIALLTFVVVVMRSSYVSLGSIIAASVFGIASYIREFSKPNPDWALLVLVALVVLMIIIKHKDNIHRLLKGEENKISFTKKGKS
jgi:glycerol-3-phosphate acyltransferase PlsY